MKNLKKFESFKEYNGTKYSNIGDIVYSVSEPIFYTNKDYDNSPKYGEKYEIIEYNGNFMTVKNIRTGKLLYNWNRRYFVTPEEWEIIKLKKDTNKYNL